MKAIKLLSVILILFGVYIFASICAAEDNSSEESISVPFKLDRNRVIVPTSVNGSEEMDLILDTGMRFDGD